MNLECTFKYFKTNPLLKKLLKINPTYIQGENYSSSYNLIGSILYKFPIEKIKIDKNRFAFQNSIYQDTIKTIFECFDPCQWTPVFVDDEFYLRDGQHRLRVADLLNLKYIDVLVLNKKNC